MGKDEILKTFHEVISYPLFELNNTTVTPTSLIVFLFIILMFILVSRLLGSKILGRILQKINIEEGLQFTMMKISRYIVISIGVIVAFQVIGINLSGLAVVLGFLSVGIGFGLQNVTSNFIAGLILLFERPIKVGDRVTVGDTEGDVENINIRSTTIRTLNNITIIVPNSDFISSSVINWTHSDRKIRVDLPVGVSYSSDLDTVIKALKEVAAENKDVLKTPPSEVHLKNFGDSSWDMSLRVWVADPKTHYYVRSELNCSIVHKFRKYGIEIPFPQRDVHFRNSISMVKDS
ncbi:MAG: mechanosensitive ion channel [Melioribacteraceae bacterium]|nr:mechanosensitive ion channel [Melioribacteraceae bacterium]MCF8264801.1 mechanosensitive ion channel [Melioribacteraceae bacterium]